MSIVLALLHALGTVSFVVAAIWNLRNAWHEMAVYRNFDAMSFVSAMGCFIGALWGIVQLLPGASI